LQQFCTNIDQLQDVLGRTIAIENPSTYMQTRDSDMDECDFLVEAIRRTGASILLDINNIVVNAGNHGWSAQRYLQRIPPSQVSEMHLAGHSIETTEHGEIRIDDHGSEVSDEVWDLFRQALYCIGKRPTLIEWDTRVPAFSVLQAQARLARDLLCTDQQNTREPVHA